jgi:putative transposase
MGAMKGHGRDRPPRLSAIFQDYDPPLYFATICCDRRKRLLDNEPMHQTFREFALRGVAEKGVAVGRYVLMPDHIHLFVRLPSDVRLTQWARMLKLVLGRKLEELGHEPAFWQRGFFDHVVRHSESYAQKWHYVRQNPVRAGLVEHAEDWPYQGEIVVIDRART